MENRKQFWETNKHLLTRDKVISTVLTYQKKPEPDQLFQDINIITPENVDVLSKPETTITKTKFYLFSYSLSEVLTETLNISEDFICFYRVASTNLLDQLNNSIETEESDIGLRTNLTHGYKDCPDKPNELIFITPKEIKILQTKDLVYYFDHEANKINPKKNLYFYGIDYPKYDIGTCNNTEIYHDKSNTLELIQTIDHIFKLATEKGKSTIIIGEIFRNCPVGLTVYYLREISKKYMFVTRIFICMHKNYNISHYNTFKKIETER